MLNTSFRRGRIAALIALSLTITGCGMLMHNRVPVPAQSEFGLGPRATNDSAYSATVIPSVPLAVGKLQTIRLQVLDRRGNPVTGARVTVDGGMPQHGHGLPTKPRVTAEEDAGVYVVQGLRFNMGGWWEIKFAIAGAAGTDSVTFNVRL